MCIRDRIRTNVLNATRNYNNRVKAFIKNIVLNKSNPMSVQYYSTKVEFQGRGAGHNHGTLWVDLNKMEYYHQDENNEWHSLDDTLKLCTVTEKNYFKRDLLRANINKCKVESSSEKNGDLEKSLQQFYTKYIQPVSYTHLTLPTILLV